MYLIEFYTEAGNHGRISQPSIDRVMIFVAHSLRLGDTITKIERV